MNGRESVECVGYGKTKKALAEIKGIDAECVELCNAINGLFGLHTSSSCCGHGKTPYHIWFDADCLCALPDLLYWFDMCHCGFRGWRVIAQTDCGKSPVGFLIEGPIGEPAYEQARRIAGLITDDNEKTRCTKWKVIKLVKS